MITLHDPLNSVSVTFTCNEEAAIPIQDARLSLEYYLVTEDWSPGDPKKKRLPLIKNLKVDFSSVEPEDNLVVRGEVEPLQQFCEVCQAQDYKFNLVTSCHS